MLDAGAPLLLQMDLKQKQAVLTRSKLEVVFVTS